MLIEARDLIALVEISETKSSISFKSVSKSISLQTLGVDKVPIS